jgi:hypothetical protein
MNAQGILHKLSFLRHGRACNINGRVVWNINGKFTINGRAVYNSVLEAVKVLERKEETEYA